MAAPEEVCVDSAIASVISELQSISSFQRSFRASPDLKIEILIQQLVISDIGFCAIILLFKHINIYSNFNSIICSN